MSDSDIFEKYAELAIQKGLIKKADLKEKLEKNPRWDSQDVSAIELLYGVKPETPKDMEYKKNIIELAHPNAVVVAPAHDKLNGLVENLIEQQNITINKIMKPTDGQLTGRKYASDELIRSLVRIANDMDNRDADELRVLADTCIEQLNKKAWVQVAAIAAIAVLGGVFLQQHLDMPGGTLEETGKRLKDELEDFLGDHLIGTEYTEDFQATVRKIIERIDLILSKYSEFRQEINNLQRPKDLEELNEYINGSAVAGPTKPDFAKFYQEFNTLVNKAYSLFSQVENRFADQSYKANQMKNVGIGERINRFFGGVFTGDKYSLVADDFKDVLRALAPFKDAIQSVLTVLSEANQHAKQELQAMQTSSAAQQTAKPAQTGVNPLAGFNPDSL